MSAEPTPPRGNPQCLSAGCVIGQGQDGVHPAADRVTNAFRRDVSSDVNNGVAKGAGWMSPMPFGGMCHRTMCRWLARSTCLTSPMPFGGMCHRTRSPEEFTARSWRSPMPFGGMCHRTPIRQWSRKNHRHVTNAFRRDVSSDKDKTEFIRQQTGSPMPFGGMCHRTVRVTPEDFGLKPSPMPFGGMCHRTKPSKEVWFDRRHKSPMPFGGMCHRTGNTGPQLFLPLGHQCLSAGCVIGQSP